MAIGKNEYHERICRLAEHARAAGLDGVLLTAESNVDYVSGYLHHAPWTLFARPFLVALNADGEAAMVAHSFLEAEVRRTAVVQDLRVYTRSGNAPVDLIAATLTDLGLASGRIGAELGYEQRLGLSYGDFQALGVAIPQARFADVSELLWRLRRIKSPAEVALMRRSAEITAEAFSSLFAEVRPGMSEREVAARAQQAMIRRGADRPGFALIAAGEGNYRCLSAKPGDRRLQAGDMLWVDLGAIYGHYWSDFSRAATIGRPSQAQLEGQKAILEVNQACIEAVRPDEPVRRVAEAAEAAFRLLGYDIRLGDGRIGHGMGLMSTEPPHVALYEETPMEEGLVFTIEPRIISAAGVFNVEELLLVTASGAEVLTTAPRELQVIE